MTKIGPNPPGIDAVKAFIEKAGKVNPVEDAQAARDFHAAQESVKGRKAAEDAASSASGENKSEKPKPSFDDVDPEIQRKLRAAGYEPPKPKTP
ncbi:MAG: hypothetical protein DI586_02115 [Micavibrio aeruginosavorus]|uniref:Uncharacterized protein n=1 Tax=Micavibrio aeruginosavorus TaxID=349221 RepID=A0A2W5HTE8_9BACT|nr:MAG: hypothetical protein DI586_02115 [Micavibrio aeruginosavorus]